MDDNNKSYQRDELLTLDGMSIPHPSVEAELAPEITEMIDGVHTSTNGPTEGNTFQFSDGFAPLIDMDSCNTEFVDNLPQDEIPLFVANTAPDELQSRCEQLGKENALLSQQVMELEEKVAELEKAKELSSQPLPAMYVQLNSTKKALGDLEKQFHDLESENLELALRLEKSNSGTHTEVFQATAEPSTLSKSSSVQSRKQASGKELKISPSPSLNKVPSKSSTTQDPMTVSRMAELESQKLVLAEKLVEKDEQLQELHRKFNSQSKQLGALEAGIDGVETRFELQISKHISKSNQKLEVLFQRAAEFEATEFELQQTISKFRQDIDGALKSVPESLDRMKGSLKDFMNKNNQEKEEMEELLETKSRNLEEAKKQISMFSEKICELNSEIEELQSYTDDLESKVARLKTERLVPQNPIALTNASTAVMEIETLKAKVSKLEAELEEQTTLNEALLHEQEVDRDERLEVRGLREHESLEQLLKENTELRNELVEVSSKLVSMEDENDSMRCVVENQDDLLGRCLNLEEELQALRTINKDLEGNLSRKKKRMEKLQSELKRLRQQMDDIDGRGFGARKQPLYNVSNQVNALVHAERRYEDQEQIFADLRSERDALLKDKVSLNKTMHSLIKENKDLSKSLNKYRDSVPKTEEKLEKAHSNIRKLQAEVQVYSLAHRHSGKGGSLGSDFDEEIVNKLISCQISLAEMDERMIKLRRELHKAVARNLYLMSKLSHLQKQR